MAVVPLITFKAGKCDADFSTTPPKIKPDPTPGYLYLYNEDDLIHLCWRHRSAPLSDPDLDLTMVPTDGTFLPYLGKDTKRPLSHTPQTGPIKGRIFVLKFSSSSQRHFFWLQSREQPPGDPSVYSVRDLRLAEIVDNLLQGVEMEDGDVESLRRGGAAGGGGQNGGDVDMEDVPGDEAAENGDAGAGAGADGSRGGDAAAGGNTHNTQTRPSTTPNLHDLLASLTPNHQQGRNQSQGPNQNIQSLLRAQHATPSTTLPDLLPTQATLPHLHALPDQQLSHLISELPLSILHLYLKRHKPSLQASNQNDTASLIESLETHEKRGLLEKVVRSPQFVQTLGALTTAVRDGGLEGVSESLGVSVEAATGVGGMAVTGGAAVERFLEGIRRGVEGRGA